MSEFSLCILQKHNCRNLDAKIPMRPDPSPMTSFRGQPLTHEMAEDMLTGWMPQPGLPGAKAAAVEAAPGLSPLPFSWKVLFEIAIIS